MEVHMTLITWPIAMRRQARSPAFFELWLHSAAPRCWTFLMFLMTMAMLWFATGRSSGSPGEFFSVGPWWESFTMEKTTSFWEVMGDFSEFWLFFTAPYKNPSHPINRNASFDMETDDTPWHHCFPFFFGGRAWLDPIYGWRLKTTEVEAHWTAKSGGFCIIPTPNSTPWFFLKSPVSDVWRTSGLFGENTAQGSWCKHRQSPGGDHYFDKLGHTGFGLYVFMCFLFLHWLYIWIMLHVIIHIYVLCLTRNPSLYGRYI